MFYDIPNIGKTVAAQCSRQNAQERRLRGLLAGEDQAAALVRFIAREFGLNSVSRYADVYDDLVFYSRTLDHPQIILDEAGDLGV